MAFVGLVPSEHSSGDQTRAAASRKPAMRISVACSSKPAWHYRHHPFVGATLQARQPGAPADAIAHAWTAQQRLYRRYHRLAARGKPKQHIVTAVARELTGFVWAALTQ